MTTTTELRAKLDELEAQKANLYAELLPFAQTGEDRRVRWRDEDVATWFGFENVDPVRAGIVAYLSDFFVTDDCRIALLGVPEIVALTDSSDFNAPRIREVDFVAAQIALTTSRLSELGG